MGCDDTDDTDPSAGPLLPVPRTSPDRPTRRRIIFTSEIDPDLPEPVRELAESLRMLARRLDNTLIGYAASINWNKATLSRWFSGRMVPGAAFVDRLMVDVDRDTGTPLTVEARERIRGLHRAAQRAVSPSVAEVQSLRDNVVSTRRRQDQAEQTVRLLEEELHRVTECADQATVAARTAELERQAQAARHSVVLDSVEEENQQLRAELEKLQRRVGQLKEALARAKRRVNEAGQQRSRAEHRLEQAEEQGQEQGEGQGEYEQEQAEYEQRLKESDAAREYAEQAARVSQEELRRLRAALEERSSAEALASWGRALLDAERYTEAIDAFQRAAAEYRKLPDRYGEVTALRGVADALARTGRFQEAIASYRSAADMYRALDDPYGEASVLNAEGNALRSVSEFEEAVRAHRRAATTYGRLDDRYGEALSTNDLGNALYRLARFEEAIAAHLRAAEGFHRLNKVHKEATALKDLGEALTQLGRHVEADDARRKASGLFGGLGPAGAQGLSDRP
ncbi:tetratricopeptide repeat protein [Kitasatospora sp. McL0602]|uniref:tetratricopeptide repeat protein n=1 Tax=Kitasatospora sp. McL0602 TaxID=3439530 RepID=UPI003F88AECC